VNFSVNNKKNLKSDRIILGIDPGTSVLGYAVICISSDGMTILAMGVLEMQKLTDHFEKLERIFNRIVSIIDEFKPEILAIEAPFYGENVQSMLKLGRAQGVSIAAAISRNLTVFEYAPRKIKMSITGNGSASKEQVAKMLQQLIILDEIPKFLDATDALAVAVCHNYQTKLPNNNSASKSTGKSTNSWKDFISKNPDRVK